MSHNASKQSEFVGLIARHQSGLNAFIISLMPGVDGVDDVLQETNLVLWEKQSSYEAGTNFLAWACQIARYKVMNHRAKLAKLGARSLDPDLIDMLSESMSIEPQELDVRMDALKKCLSRLPEAQREIVEHRYIKERPLSRVAEEYGRTVESLKVSLFRIRAALKKCISSEINIERTQS